jgi:uncharacterized protein (TIGR03435 family)
MQRFALAFCFAVAAFSQTTSPLSFEVASIRPGRDVFSTRPEIAGGTFRWTTQLAYLVGYAHDLDFSRVSSRGLGGQGLGAIYRIEATFNPAASNTEVREMVQSLLAERFKMQAHVATMEGEGYALSVGKSGIKLKPTPEDAEGSIAATLPKQAGLVEITAKSATFTQLAVTLARALGTPVWDRTGRSGRYDFDFLYATDLGNTGAPWIGTALQETLGLNLEKAKGPVETLVVDHIEEPSDN